MTNVQIVLEHLLPLLVTVVTPFIMILARRAIQFAEMKFKVDFDEKQEAKFLSLLNEGIHRAEEAGHKALKVDEKEKSEGQKKLDNAIEYVLEEAQRMGMDRVVNSKREHLEAKVEALLGIKRHDPADHLKPTPNS